MKVSVAERREHNPRLRRAGVDRIVGTAFRAALAAVIATSSTGRAGTDQTGLPTELPPVPPPTLGDQLAAIEPALILIGGLALCITLGVVIGRVGVRGGRVLAAVPSVAAAVIGLYWGNQVATSRASASEFGVALAAAVGMLGTIVLGLVVLFIAWIGRLRAGRATPLVKGTAIAAAVAIVAVIVGFAAGPPVP